MDDERAEAERICISYGMNIPAAMGNVPGVRPSAMWWGGRHLA